jgi:predicted porin
MKKSLLAVAAIGAFASAAQAQSSVTVYGIMDVGFAGVTSRVSTPTATTKTNSTSFSGTGSESTSRLGFRGTEDLGGGTSAFFTAEFQLYPTDYNLSGDAQGGLFNRQSFVGLKKNGIGQASVGTQYTPMHIAVSRVNAGQQNNMVGSVLYAPSGAQGSGATTSSYTVRQNNALNAQTDNFAGFTLSGQYSNKNSDTTVNAAGTTGGNNNTTGYGVGLNYVWKKLNVDAVYQSFKNETDAGSAMGAVSLPTAASTTRTAIGLVNGSNLTDNQSLVGATYDFGILKAYAGWINRKATSAANSNQFVKRSGQEIGVRSFITPKIEGWANIGNGRYSAYGVGSPTANFTAYQIGSNYLLSKRTNLYAIYGQTVTSSTSTGSAAGSSYGVGVRHTF